MKDNELIAEFMGGAWETVYIGGQPNRQFRFPNQHITEGFTDFEWNTFYHKDWNWLMGAIKKWDNLFQDPVEQNIRSEYINRCNKMDNAVTSFYDIELAYKQLVENIQWYNSQKKEVLTNPIK